MKESVHQDAMLSGSIPSRAVRTTPDKLIINTAIFIVLFYFLFMVSGCSYYKIQTTYNYQPDLYFKTITEEVYKENMYPRNKYPEEILAQKFFLERDIYIITQSGRWYLVNPSISNDTITGIAVFSPLIPGASKKSIDYRRSQRYSSKDEGYIIKRIVFHVNNLDIKDNDTVKIPVSEIRYCDIYKKDALKSALGSLGAVAIVIGGIYVLSVIILVIIFAASGGFTSCPFVYLYNGNDWQFIGEIYGGATYPVLERADYLKLPEIYGDTGSGFQVKLCNFLDEVQFIDHAGLVILEHDSTVYPLIDKYGSVQTVSDPLLPIAARDSRGSDCTEEISTVDYFTHDFDEDLDTSENSNYLNSLELTFRSDTSPGSGKLYINGKNSLWGDHMVREFYNLFGNRYQKFVKKQESQPASFHLEWMKQQGLLLQVYVMKDSAWQKQDFFMMTGAFGSRDMILPLDLENAWSPDIEDTSLYTVKIKLESGFNFWKVDYAAVDLGRNAEVDRTFIMPDDARDQDGIDVKQHIAGDDGDYLVQKTRGEELMLDFTLPASGDHSVTIFFQSKGYYQQAWMSDTEPDLSLLETFRKPGRLSQWSSQRYSEQMKSFQAANE